MLICIGSEIHLSKQTTVFFSANFLDPGPFSSRPSVPIMCPKHNNFLGESSVSAGCLEGEVPEEAREGAVAPAAADVCGGQSGSTSLDHTISQLVMRPTLAIIFGINLNFSQPCQEKMWTRVSQGTRERERERETERKREREKGGKLEGEIRRKINVTWTRAVLIGLSAHRFQYIICTRKGG